MGLSRSRTIYLVTLLVLVALSLRRVERVEAFVDSVFVPTRVLGFLARPLNWLSLGTLRAAQARASAQASDERTRALALLAAAQAAAFPSDPALRVERGLVGALTLGRVPNNRDVLLVRFPADVPVEIDMPLVCGDVFVGRVIAVTRADAGEPGEAQVQLVTARGFRVGAVIEGSEDSARLVVGGLVAQASASDHGLHLAAHFPSERALEHGSVRVLESTIGAGGELRARANGFRLGELASFTTRGVRVLAVRALIDYEHGLGELAIVTGPELATAGVSLAQDPFEPSAWVEGALRLCGDVSSWRATRKLEVGTRGGVRAGAAVAFATRFVGRVLRAGPFSSDVALLGDSGLSFSALARVEGRTAPLLLGRLVSQGIEDGELLLRWDAVLALPVELGEPDGIPAELFTSAGERDVPPGLLIGRTLLPRGPGPFVLRIVPAQSEPDFARARVWTGSQAAHAPLEGS